MCLVTSQIVHPTRSSQSYHQARKGIQHPSRSFFVTRKCIVYFATIQHAVKRELKKRKKAVIDVAKKICALKLAPLSVIEDSDVADYTLLEQVTTCCGSSQ